MKKIIPFVMAASALMLAGCFNFGGKSNNNSQGNTTSNTTSQQPVEYVINLAAVNPTFNDAEKDTYPTEASAFQVGGVHFSATNGVGRPLAKNNAGYNALNAMQFNKADDTSKTPTRLRGAITNSDALSVTVVECYWYATYEEEETKYFPVVKAGDSADSLAAVAADQTSATTGTATGQANGQYAVYEHLIYPKVNFVLLVLHK